MGPLGSNNWGMRPPSDDAFVRRNLKDLTTASIIGWTASGAYSIASATRDSDGVITTASVSWPDGSLGTLTRTAKNQTFLTIDSYTITHSASGKTVTQSAVTRDSLGNITAQPALSIT